MIKTIIAANLMILAGMNYLKPATESYQNLEGFYTIIGNTELQPVNLKYNTYSRIIVYDDETLNPLKIFNEYETRINYDATSGVRIQYKENSQQISWTSYQITSIGANLYRYVYFHNVKIAANQTALNFVKQNEVNGGCIVNKTYNLKNFNPVGFLNHSYTDNMLIPAAITTPINILQDYTAIYKGHIVSEMKSTWINAQASYIQTNNASRPIALITDDNSKLYMYTTIKYYDENIEDYTTEYVSNSVYDNRVNSDSEIVGTYLTNKLNNVDEKLYVMGLENEQDQAPEYPLDTFFKYYDIQNGTTIGIDGNIGDVFNLLSQCFMGIGGFFGIALIPGITLGALFFLPFIVSLIIWLINLFKRH